VLLLALLALDGARAAWAQIGWPTPSAWSPVRTRNFNNVRDVTGDMAPRMRTFRLAAGSRA
jgi:hypothetical protein